MKLQQYELVQKINEGGSGAIYKAVNTFTGSLVAIKILNKAFHKNQKVLQKFQFEANQYLYLVHRNIVKLLDFNIDAYPYLVMEFVEGVNLDQYINKITGPIPVDKAVDIMGQLFSAIGFAHSKGILHLDIKPLNIMIKKDRQIKILDFGIAKMLNEEQDKMFAGSPYYMSPEQVEDKELDKSSDIYSLGITFFQIITGQLPFPANCNRNEVQNRIQKGQLDPASSKYPAISAEIEKIISKATALKKENRFHSCLEFQIALNNTLN